MKNFTKKFVCFCTLLALSTSNLNVLAIDMVFESYISQINKKFEIIGETDGEQFGALVKSVDFNSDGRDDLIVSSPFFSLKDKKWVGKVEIFLGNNNSTVFYGEDEGDQFGSSLEIGDFNVDGVNDLVVGAFNGSFNNHRPGKVYIIYGGKKWGSQTSSQVDNRPYRQIVDFVSNKPNVVLTRDKDKSGFGLSTLSCDLNNDGFNDLVVGAPMTYNLDGESVGAVYIYYGSKHGLNLENPINIYGEELNSKFGASLAAGNFFDPIRKDLIIGSYMANDIETSVGKVYYYKTDTEINFSDSSKGNPYLLIQGLNNNEWLGFNLESGDLNNDGYSDLAVVSFPFKGNNQDSKINIFYGGNNFLKDKSISITDSLGDNLLGKEILFFDLDRDKNEEILIGSPGINLTRSNSEGDVYILDNENSSFKKSYSISKNQVSEMIHGENPDDWFGSSITVMDFNTDGYLDLIVGSRYSDGQSSINNGKVFVLLGDNNSFGQIKSISGSDVDKVNRGEFVKIVLDSFDLKEKKSEFIDNCYEFLDFCLFNFMAMSSFDGITTKPEVLLYPDVTKKNKYYDDINVATILGLVNGYMDEKDSPFYPDRSVSRIQALKIVLGASGLVSSKYKFELVAMMGSYKNLISQKSYFKDIDSRIERMWWYPRYINFAVENGIIDKGDYFRPDDNITADELNDIIKKTLEVVKNKERNEKINS